MKRQTYTAQICKCLANQSWLYLHSAAMQQRLSIWISILIHEMHGRFQPGSEPSELQTEGTLVRLGIQTYYCEQLGRRGEKPWWGWPLFFRRTARMNCNCWWVWTWGTKQSHAWNGQFGDLKIACVSSYQSKHSSSEECRGIQAW